MSTSEGLMVLVLGLLPLVPTWLWGYCEGRAAQIQDEINYLGSQEDRT